MGSTVNPRNSSLFTRLVLTRRCTWGGHETYKAWFEYTHLALQILYFLDQLLSINPKFRYISYTPCTNQEQTLQVCTKALSNYVTVYKLLSSLMSAVCFVGVQYRY